MPSLHLLDEDIKEYADWRFVSVKQVQQYGGSTLLWHYKGSLVRVLQALYPDHCFPITNKKSNFSKTQHLLYQCVQQVFFFSKSYFMMEDISTG